MAISKTQIKITIIKMENKKRTTNLNQISIKSNQSQAVVGWELEIYSIYASIQAISLFIQSAEFLWVWSRFSATDRLKLTNLIINPNKKLQYNSIACLPLFAIATYFSDQSTFHIYVFVHQHFFYHRIYVEIEKFLKIHNILAVLNSSIVVLFRADLWRGKMSSFYNQQIFQKMAKSLKVESVEIDSSKY